MRSLSFFIERNLFRDTTDYSVQERILHDVYEGKIPEIAGDLTQIKILVHGLEHGKTNLVKDRAANHLKNRVFYASDSKARNAIFELLLNRSEGDETRQFLVGAMGTAPIDALYYLLKSIDCEKQELPKLLEEMRHVIEVVFPDQRSEYQKRVAWKWVASQEVLNGMPQLVRGLEFEIRSFAIKTLLSFDDAYPGFLNGINCGEFSNRDERYQIVAIDALVANRAGRQDQASECLLTIAENTALSTNVRVAALKGLTWFHEINDHVSRLGKLCSDTDEKIIRMTRNLLMSIGCSSFEGPTESQESEVGAGSRASNPNKGPIWLISLSSCHTRAEQIVKIALEIRDQGIGDSSLLLPALHTALETWKETPMVQRAIVDTLAAVGDASSITYIQQSSCTAKPKSKALAAIRKRNGISNGPNTQSQTNTPAPNRPSSEICLGTDRFGLRDVVNDRTARLERELKELAEAGKRHGPGRKRRSRR